MSGTGLGVGRGRTLVEVFVIAATYDLTYPLWAHSGFFVKFSSRQGANAHSTASHDGACGDAKQSSYAPVFPPDPTPFYLVGTSAQLSPDISAWEFLIGKEPVMPKTLLLKTVEVPLRMAMQVIVTAKKLWVQEEVSTFTSTVITTKMASMTVSEASTRT